MNVSNLENIQKAQTEYQKLIVCYNDLFRNNGNSLKKIAVLLDEIHYFWLEQLEVIEFELEELTEKHTCLLLCGAIYLDVVSNYEHYYFKSLGAYHLLFDPFLKIEPFIRVPEDRVDSKETIDLFERVLSDTIEILDKYKNIFYILPIRELAIKNHDEHNALLKKTFVNMISDMFEKEFINQDDFCNQYESFEQIEREMKPYIREILIFNDQSDRGMILRKKIEKYCENQTNFSELTKGQSEAQIFLISIYTYFSQIIDILLICMYLRVVPYIRFEITFHYLILMMHIFSEDERLKAMIEKTIVMYLFRKIIDADVFKEIDFNEYYSKIKKQNILDDILNKIHEEQLDIFHGGVKKVELIIVNEFEKCIKKPD